MLKKDNKEKVLNPHLIKENDQYHLLNNQMIPFINLYPHYNLINLVKYFLKLSIKY